MRVVPTATFGFEAEAEAEAAEVDGFPELGPKPFLPRAAGFLAFARDPSSSVARDFEGRADAALFFAAVFGGKLASPPAVAAVVLALRRFLGFASVTQGDETNSPSWLNTLVL